MGNKTRLQVTDIFTYKQLSTGGNGQQRHSSMTYTQHRADLKNICAHQLKQAVEEIGLKDSINRKLELFYSQGDETVLFRTFDEWVKMGYKVNKGEKGLKFWGTPQEFEIRNPQHPEKVDGIGSFCPIVFKFSENQVYRLENLR